MASFTAANAYKPLQHISKETPVEEIANKLYDFWKSNSLIKFVGDVTYTMRPILLDARGYPNEKYKDFLSYFAFNYEKYPKDFITTLFLSALEEAAITGTIRIVANPSEFAIVESRRKESVFVDSALLIKLKELYTIMPSILNDCVRNSRARVKNATINNTIINALSMKRPDTAIIENSKRPIISNSNINTTEPPLKRRRHMGQGGTRKRRRKSKATRKLHRKKHCN